MTAEINELWQLYNELGQATGKGFRNDILTKGLLHGASHVWIWRQTKNGAEVLLQKRSANKRTWPNLYDISAAGHIDYGEDPAAAALRETKEEINLKISKKDLKLISVLRAYMVAPSGDIENEFRWLYLLKMDSDEPFEVDKYEVAKIEWKSLDSFKKELKTNPKKYVPHGKIYYDIVVSAIEQESIGN